MTTAAAGKSPSGWGALTGIIVVVLLLAAGGGYFLYTQYLQIPAPSAAVDETQLQQAAPASTEDTLESELEASGNADLSSDLNSLEQSF